MSARPVSNCFRCERDRSEVPGCRLRTCPPGAPRTATRIWVCEDCLTDEERRAFARIEGGAR
jgi:hypothetical protein